MNVKLVELREICDFLDNQRIPITDFDRQPGPYPYYGANGQQDLIDGYIFDEPLVLLAEDGGHFGSKTKPIAYKVTGKCWVNNHAHVLRPKDNCDVDYLHRVLSYYDVAQFVNGTTREKLTKNQAERILIPFPSLLEEQKRIAAILEKADRLRRLRRYALDLSDTYLQTVFLEMFGDPVTNPKNWEVKLLGDMLAITPHIGTITPAREVGRQLCVRVGEVGEWHINLAQCKYVSLNDQEFKRFSLLPDDIVLARAIGSESHLGKLSIMGKTTTPVVFDSHIMRVRPDRSQLLAFFLARWLKTDGGRARFMQQARRTSVQFNINSEQIEAIKIPVPPLPLQQNFVQIIETHLRLQAQQREAARQAEHLFQTLLHQAFQGELTLEVEDMPDVAMETMRYKADITDVDKAAYQMAFQME